MPACPHPKVVTYNGSGAVTAEASDVGK